jgi:hypothetical protein
MHLFTLLTVTWIAYSSWQALVAWRPHNLARARAIGPTATPMTAARAGRRRPLRAQTFGLALLLAAALVPSVSSASAKGMPTARVEGTSAAPGTAPQDATPRTEPGALATRPVPQGVHKGYAAREEHARSLEKFAGGDTTIILGSSALVLVLVVVLIVVLL